MILRLLFLVCFALLFAVLAAAYQSLRVPRADLTPRAPAPSLHLSPTQIHYLLEPPQLYRYYGTREQRGPVTLSLDSSTVPDGHVAVWFGANYGFSRWVQAGVADVGGGPNLYIETKGTGDPTINMWPTTLGQKARVRVGSRGGCWRVTIDSYTSPWVWFRHRPTLLSTLETLGNATGSGRIGRRVVRS